MAGVETNMDDFINSLNAEVEAVNSNIDDALRYAGLQCVTDARHVDTYTDQTGNLRHSIGYAIVDEGIVTEQSLETIEGNKASEAIEREARDLRRFKALIVVAGMPYASFVEAKGYDVITGSSLKLLDNFKAALE